MSTGEYLHQHRSSAATATAATVDPAVAIVGECSLGMALTLLIRRKLAVRG